MSFGNSHVFTGIRFNYRDSNVQRINGLNLTLKNPKDAGKNEVATGINIGFFPIAKGSQPFTFGLFAAGAKRLNGFSAAGLILGSYGNINGFSFSGLYTMADGADSRINGLAISGYAHNRIMHGLSIALFNRVTELHGVELGLFNYVGNNPKILRIMPIINYHW